MSIYREDEYLRKLIQKVALKHGVSYYQAYDVYHSRFGLTRETLDKLDIEHDYFPVVAIPFVGKFAIKIKKRRSLVKKYTKWALIHKPKINKDESIKDRTTDPEGCNSESTDQTVPGLLQES